MDYQEIADILVKESGRYDLVKEDGSDNGLLRFVNSGQRMLDRKSNHFSSEARSYMTVTEGDYYFVVPECRVIESVWLLDQPAGIGALRYPLIKTTWDDIQIRFNMLASELTKGKPNEFSIGSFRLSPDPRKTYAENVEVFAGFVDGFANPNFDYNAILFGPASDGDYGFQVVGKFYTPKFDSQITETFWSVQHPEALIASARFWMEVANRNTEGRRDWEGIIQDYLTDLEKENIEQSIIEEQIMGVSDE